VVHLRPHQYNYYVMNIVIIGNGIAGSTAARYIRKWSEHHITMISDEGKYPFSRTAMMYVYMGHMTQKHIQLYEDEFWANNKINLLQASVQSIEVTAKKVILSNGNKIEYDKLIVASGSKPNKFNWPGQDLERVSGFYHMSDLDRITNATKEGIKNAVIVGGGLIGIELAEMFRTRHMKVIMLVREQSFWCNVLPNEESLMVTKHIMDHGVELLLNTQLTEIIGKDGRVCSVRTNYDEMIDCDYVGLTVGVSPNIDFLKNSTIKVNRGILVNAYMQTSEQSIYAIGDCAELIKPNEGRKNIEAVWYAGRAMGQIAAANVCGKVVAYDQGVWYNSAKFFDIEYQVYGFVPTTYDETTMSIFWQHPSENKSIRIVYSANGTILGFHLMGIRYRHEVCERWIKDNYNIEEVLAHLSLANFDPEFFEMYETKLIDLYNAKHGTSIALKSKRKLNLVQKFFSKK
jgi:3-phenylpropionate/trans-cinnamate dioxygenase ferredoxin reductase component